MIKIAFPSLFRSYFSLQTPTSHPPPERYRTSDNNSHPPPTESGDPVPACGTRPGAASCAPSVPPRGSSWRAAPVS